jgi:CBS domain-containing protein
LEKGGEHHHTLDLKHKGITPIIDMTRVYSLAYGINATNTADRLKTLIPTPAIATEDGANLRDTLEFIAYIRLHHQGAQIAQGKDPDNFVDPDILSSFERQHLKTAFNIVRRMQNTLSQRYLTSFLS